MRDEPVSVARNSKARMVVETVLWGLALVLTYAVVTHYNPDSFSDSSLRRYAYAQEIDVYDASMQRFVVRAVVAGIEFWIIHLAVGLFWPKRS